MFITRFFKALSELFRSKSPELKALEDYVRIEYKHDTAYVLNHYLTTGQFPGGTKC